MGLTLLSYSSKYDFTRFSNYLYIALIVFFISHLVVVYICVASDATEDEFTPVKIAFAILKLCLFSTFFIMDTQMMLGGDFEFAYFLDEHAIAVVHFYVDVLFIIQIIMDLFAYSRVLTYYNYY